VQIANEREKVERTGEQVQIYAHTRSSSLKNPLMKQS